MKLCTKSLEVVLGIFFGTRSHKDLKEAFDWEATPEGHQWWSIERQRKNLSHEARKKLNRLLEANGITEKGLSL